MTAVIECRIQDIVKYEDNINPRLCLEIPGLFRIHSLITIKKNTSSVGFGPARVHWLHNPPVNQYRSAPDRLVAVIGVGTFIKDRNNLKIMKLPPRESKERNRLMDYVCLLRYRTSTPHAQSLSYVSLQHIRAIVGYSERTINDLCKERISEQGLVKRTKRKSKLDGFVTR